MDLGGLQDLVGLVGLVDREVREVLVGQEESHHLVVQGNLEGQVDLEDQKVQVVLEDQVDQVGRGDH